MRIKTTIVSMAMMSLLSITANATTAVTHELQNGCKVKIEKIAPKEIKVGSFFDYFLRIENVGKCDLRDLEVFDKAPERVKFEAAYPEPKYVQNEEGGEFLKSVSWKIRELEAYEVKIIHLRVHVVGPPRRTLINSACVKGDYQQGVSDCDISKTEVVTGGGDVEKR